MSDVDRGIRSYVLRSGRMTDSQRRALDRYWLRYGLEYDARSNLDLSSAFGNSNPVVAEIGFGMGQATWRIAAERPDINYLGLEVHTPGVGRLVYDLESRGIANVRIFRHDAVEVFERMIAARLVCRPAPLLSRSLAQEAAPQATPRPRRPLGSPGLAHRARRLPLLRNRHRGLRELVARRPLAHRGPAQPIRGLRASTGMEARDQVRVPCIARRQGRLGAALRPCLSCGIALLRQSSEAPSLEERREFAVEGSDFLPVLVARASPSSSTRHSRLATLSLRAVWKPREQRNQYVPSESVNRATNPSSLVLSLARETCMTCTSAAMRAASPSRASKLRFRGHSRPKSASRSSQGAILSMRSSFSPSRSL